MHYRNLSVIEILSLGMRLRLLKLEYTFRCSQWWDSAGLQRFYGAVSWNFIRSANRPALLFMLVQLVRAEDINLVIEPADKKVESLQWV